MAKNKTILGNGTRFNIWEQSSLKDGSRLWAVWDNVTQEFVKDSNALNGIYGEECTRVEFYRYEDALELRNKLELKYLFNKKSNLNI